MPRRCRTCDYLADAGAGSFQCRRSAPTLVVLGAPPGSILRPGADMSPDMLGTWPPTQAELWCGEWRRRDEEPSAA